MKNNMNILWIFVATCASNNLSGITLTEQERIMIGANRQLFLKVLADTHKFEGNASESLDLRGVDLKKLPDPELFMGSTITNVNLSNADLSDVNIKVATFTNVNLTDAKLRNAKASRTHFWQCNLTGADFTNANMSGVQIIGEPGHPVQAKNLVAVGANISSSSLLFYVDLSGANMEDCNFQNSTLSHITVNDQTIFKYNDKTNPKDTGFSMAQLDNWNGYHGDLKQWLLGKVGNEKLLADTSIDTLNTRIPQN